MEVIYYVAMSLDSFIARKDGDISWLSGVEREGEDYGYKAFYGSMDAVVMGRKTYELCLTFPEWPYPEKPAWVFSRCPDLPVRQNVKVVDVNPSALMDQLEKSGLNKVWLVGGGELARSFRSDGLITEYIVSIIPVVLGSGIPMIAGDETSDDLSLESVTGFPSSLVQIRYKVKRGQAAF